MPNERVSTQPVPSRHRKRCDGVAHSERELSLVRLRRVPSYNAHQFVIIRNHGTPKRADHFISFSGVAAENC